MLLAASGALYNALAVHRLRAAYPPPGRIYTVNGHAMHLYCTGAGSPTVVLESGQAESFLVWGKVQPGLSRTTRVCSYDRAGLGWSEAADGPRDSGHIAAQLHALLAQAGIGGPLVLTGHSAGGRHIRVYRARYPQQVAGLVFVDATTAAPGQTPARAKTPHVDALDRHSQLAMALFQAAIALGIPRILGDCVTPPPGFDATANLWRADACRPAYVTAVRREQAAGPQSEVEVERAGGLGDLPILVLSRDTRAPRPRALPASVPTAEWRQAGRNHDAAQEALAHLSTHGRRIIARGSSHYIHFDRPALVVSEVNAFVQRIRDGRDQPDPGTTMTK
jgi:pimeloyl-ACP methyl ester carboxylesterase